MYWWPDGAYKGRKYELGAACARLRQKKLPKPEKFQKTMEALIAAWEQVSGE